MKQGYSCGHFILTSAMKQVVLHEVSHVYCCRLVGFFINIFVFFLVLNSFMQLCDAPNQLDIDVCVCFVPGVC